MRSLDEIIRINNEAAEKELAATEEIRRQVEAEVRAEIGDASDYSAEEFSEWRPTLDAATAAGMHDYGEGP